MRSTSPLAVSCGGGSCIGVPLRILVRVTCVVLIAGLLQTMAGFSAGAVEVPVFPERVGGRFQVLRPDEQVLSTKVLSTYEAQADASLDETDIAFVDASLAEGLLAESNWDSYGTSTGDWISAPVVGQTGVVRFESGATRGMCLDAETMWRVEDCSVAGDWQWETASVAGYYRLVSHTGSPFVGQAAERTSTSTGAEFNLAAFQAVTRTAKDPTVTVFGVHDASHCMDIFGTGDPGASIQVTDSSGAQLVDAVVSDQGKWGPVAAFGANSLDETLTATQSVGGRPAGSALSVSVAADETGASSPCAQSGEPDSRVQASGDHSTGSLIEYRDAGGNYWLLTAGLLTGIAAILFVVVHLTTKRRSD